MKNKLIIALLLVISFSYAQVPIGFKYDVNSVPFNGYYDALTYNPEKSIATIFKVEGYNKGYFFTKSGKKTPGLIKYGSNKIWFKTKKDTEGNKIKANEIEGFVVGVDSFYSISKYKNGVIVKNSALFFQRIASTDKYVFLKGYTGSQGSFSVNYSVKTKGTDEWEYFPKDYDAPKYTLDRTIGTAIKKNKFKKVALKYFGDIPYLKEKILSKDFSFDKIVSMIKIVDYLEKYKQHEAILYDKYWQETKDKKRAIYHANIVTRQDSIWTLDYYADKTKLYQGHYTSFYPNVKTGDFIAYYPDGSVRQITFYQENKPKEVKFYKENGDLYMHYKYVERRCVRGKYQAIEYITVNDESGKNIIDEYDRTSLSIIDTIDGLDYTNEYENYRLVSSYRLQAKDTIFKVVDRAYEYKIVSLQRKFDTFMQDKDFDLALQDNAQGIVFLNVLVSPKGYPLSVKIMNKVHPEFDQLVSYFVNTKILAGKKHKFFPYKTGKKKQFYEMVIPIVFTVDYFYHHPNNNYYYDNWFLQNQIQIQEQMQNRMNNIPTNLPRVYMR